MGEGPPTFVGMTERAGAFAGASWDFPVSGVTKSAVAVYSLSFVAEGVSRVVREPQSMAPEYCPSGPRLRPACRPRGLAAPTRPFPDRMKTFAVLRVADAGRIPAGGDEAQHLALAVRLDFDHRHGVVVGVCHQQ